MNTIKVDLSLKGKSKTWANWMSELSPTTCKPCAKQHGKIFEIYILNGKDEVEVNAHPNGKCLYVPMRTKAVETATNQGTNGADAYLFYLKRLPPNYVDKKVAESQGWENKKGNLDTVLPGKIIGGDIYNNRERKLPSSTGRIWYEADINYTGGYRNTERLLYSNDGLIFVTYDHYQTFYEIIK